MIKRVFCCEFFKKLRWLGALLSLVSGSFPTAAQVVGIQSQPVDICGSVQRVILVVTVGTIHVQDSLLSFAVEIGYDPSRLTLTTLLKANTLSETMDFVQMHTVEDGVVVVEGGNVQRFLQSTGAQKAVVAIAGSVRGPQCPDTSYVVLRRVTFGRLHNNTVIDVPGTIGKVDPVVLMVRDKPDRQARLNVYQHNTVLTMPVDTLQLTVAIQNVFNNRVDTVSLYFRQLDDKGDVQDVQLFPAAGLGCDQPEWNAEQQRYEWKCYGDSNWTSVVLSIQAVLSTPSVDTMNFALGILQVLPICHCVTRFDTNRVMVKWQQISGVQTESVTRWELISAGTDGVEVHTRLPMTKIEVYDSMGRKILDVPVQAGRRYCWIPTMTWSRGLYAVALYFGQERRIKWVYRQ